MSSSFIKGIRKNIFEKYKNVMLSERHAIADLATFGNKII